MNLSKIVFVCFLLILFLSQSTALIPKQLIPVNSTEKLHPELISLTQNSPLTSIKVLIEVKNEEALKEISLLTKNLNGKNIQEFQTGKIVVAEIPAGKLNELALNQKIKFIYPDRQIKAALNDSIPIINADTAWSYGFTGQEIKIAVLDTGIDSSHEMLQGKVILAEDFSGSGNPTDVFGHGTHVAGIATGTTINGGTYNGTAPNAVLLNGKVLNDYGIGTSATVIAGINWAVNPDGNLLSDDKADIINLSLGAAYSDLNDPINLALNDAIQQGIIVIAAAGNCGESCPSMTCGSFRGIGVPGDNPNAITVGATDKQNNWACFSAGGIIPGVGVKPDLSAPGVNINSSIPNNGYATKSGTSMSAPFVSGAVALMLEANPLMTPQEIKQWLELNALDLGLAGKDSKYGSGLIDLTNIDKINSQENLPPIFNSINIPNEILAGNPLELTVNVSDDENVNEVNAMIENPLGNQTTLNLIQSDNNFWHTEFNDTNILGNYLIELRAEDNTGLETIINASFSSVNEFNDSNNFDANFFGFESELTVPSEIIKEIQGLINLNLFLIVPAEFAAEVPPLDTTIEFFVRDSTGKIINKEFVGPIEVPANQNADFNYYWTSGIVNDYNIGAIVLAEGNKIGENEKSTLVTVPEDSAEIISFNLSSVPSIEKGTTQHYLINTKNNSMLSLNSFAEIMFFDENNNLVHSLSGNKVLIDSNSSFSFD
ncbi:S8 family serine peptidase, partial [Candidatus Micrarchaeota archaeon]|nr:S8 family serine peptidase [Candidatus Micrarchaeota archaeon]